MSHYQCCYSSGRQFIFTERPRLVLAGLIVASMAGLFLGLCMGVAISVAGSFSFELVMVGAAVFLAYKTYLLTSIDIGGYCVFLLMLGLAMSLLLFLGRWSLEVDLGPTSRCALFSACLSFLSLVTYGYALCLQEDERKHHLDLCTPDGTVLDDRLAEDDRSVDQDNWEMLCLFVRWIMSWQWWLDINAKLESRDDEESMHSEDSEPCDVITVHNRTLKLVKVCFYSPEDIFCFVPFGGVSGNYVGLIRSEECRKFRMPHRLGRQYKLKVFQPGVFDRELAFCTAKHGQTLAFFDVEGMVKRSRLLSSGNAVAHPAASVPQSDTSDDEHRDLPQGFLTLDKPLHAAGGAFGSVGSLMRSRSASTQSLARSSDGSSTPSRSDSPKKESSPSQALEVRKAAPDEVVVRNRSNQEIRALLFRSNDYCYMVPLIGKLLACGDSIPPDGERRFVPKIADKDFTLKVYSVGAGARELTYLTVYCGHTYTFCDSLLS